MNLAIYLLVAILAALALAALINLHTGRPRNQQLIILALSLAIYALALWLKPDNLWLLNAAILLAAFGIGHLISRLVPGPPALIAFLITAAIIDVFSFSGGLTRQLINQPSLLRYLAITLPLDGRQVAVMGVGDLVIFAAAYTVLRKSGFSKILAYLAPVVGLLLAILIGSFIGGVYAIPFIAVTTLAGLALANRQTAKQR